MPPKNKKILLSYSWANYEQADDLDKYFKTIGIELIRDVKDIQLGESIKTFMDNEIKRSQKVIMLISDSYLKSENCMYEAIELFEQKKFAKSGLPILIDSNLSIFKSEGRIRYHEFWEQYLNIKIENARRYNTEDFYAEVLKVKKIQSQIGSFFKQFLEKKAISYKALRQENFISLLNVLGYQEQFTIEELALVLSEKNIELKKYRLSEFVFRYPIFKPGLYALGSLLEEIKEFEEAKRCFSKLIEIDKTEDNAYVGYGAILSNVDKQYQAALNNFLTGIEFNPLNFTCLVNIGTVYSILKEYQKAEDYFYKALEVYDADPDLHFKLGVLLEKATKYILADTHYQRAIDLGTKSIEHFLTYANYLEKQKNYQKAFEIYEEAKLLLTKDATTYFKCALLLRDHLNDLTGAVLNLKTAIEIDPHFLNAYNNLALILAMNFHDYENAIELLHKSIEINPRFAQAYADLGTIYSSHLNEETLSIVYFKRALSLDSNNTNALTNLGVLYVKLGKNALAEGLFQRFVFLKPSDDNGLCNYAGTLYGRKAFAEAFLLYEKAALINPSNENALLNAGALAINLKNFELAKEFLMKLLVLNDKTPILNFNLGMLFKQKKKFDKAKYYFEKEIFVNPDYDDAYISLSHLLEIVMNNLSEAKVILVRLLERKPDSYLGNYEMGILCERLGQIIEANHYLKKAKNLKQGG